MALIIGWEYPYIQLSQYHAEGNDQHAQQYGFNDLSFTEHAAVEQYIDKTYDGTAHQERPFG